MFTARIRRMGKVMFSVCPHLGGYPYPIMLCNISQNAMGQPGEPCLVQLGGYPAGGVSWRRVPWWGGTQIGYPPSQVGGGTQIGQQKEYSLHGRRYASCVHAGGLSCFIFVYFKFVYIYSVFISVCSGGNGRSQG